jgi:hypothetical protein
MMFDVGFGSFGVRFGGVFMVSLGEDRHSGFLAVFAKALSRSLRAFTTCN